MNRKVGLWIDHRKAVIVSITGESEEIKTMLSGMEKHVRFSGEAQAGTEEDIRDRRFTNHLNKYYDKVIAFIRNADLILIMGPGEAKGEIKRRIENENIANQTINIETADKMMNPQIASKVRQYFQQSDVN
jgi:hypothetical protein